MININNSKPSSEYKGDNFVFQQGNVKSN
jgi:hypothetical protein